MSAGLDGPKKSNSEEEKPNLLDRLLGSKDAGDRARAEIRERQRNDDLRWRALAMANDRGREVSISSTARPSSALVDVLLLKSQVQQWALEAIDEKLSAELPEAVDVLVTQSLSRNNRAPTRT
jgi:hypothetical protein